MTSNSDVYWVRLIAWFLISLMVVLAVSIWLIVREDVAGSLGTLVLFGSSFYLGSNFTKMKSYEIR